MKKGLVLVLLLLGGFWYWRGGVGPSWPILHETKNAQKIVAFGDSLTVGAGAPSESAYPAYLAKLAGLEVINEGRSGDTTADALSRVSDVTRHNPELVIVLLGGNDLLRRTPLSETLDNLRQIFSGLQDKGAMVAFAAIQPPLVGDNWTLALGQLCKESGVLFIPDVMTDLWQDSSKMADDIHPNDAGYKIMAERIFEGVRPYLSCANC